MAVRSLRYDLIPILCLIVILAVATPCLAVTTVADVILFADGTYASGRLYIVWPSFVVDSRLIGAGHKTVTIGANGAVSTTLEPVDAAVPSGTQYTVTYFLANGESHSEFWLVTTSTPVTIQAIRSFTATTTSTSVSIANISGGTTKGDLIVHSGSSFFRFAAGTTGKVLAANSGETLGLEWISPLTNPMSALGDAIYGGASGAATRLVGNITTTRKFLRQVGDGAASAAPVWDQPEAADISDLHASTDITADLEEEAHAAEHQHGGADEIATATAAANVIPKTGAGGTLAIGFLATGTPTGSKFVRDDGTLVVPGGVGDVIGPATNTADYMAQWDGADSKTLKDGLAVASANTASAIVQRDISGNFAAGTITAALTGNASTATALAANPNDCSSSQFANAIDASGNLTCAALVDDDVPNDLTASNYLLLAGGTLTGQLIADNLGIDFLESDTNPTCAAGVYVIYADLSEGLLKKCMDGVVTNLDTTGSVGADEVGTYQFNDGTDTPLVSEFVRVDSADTGKFMYSTVAQVLTALNAQTLANDQSGVPRYCASSDGTDTYTCTLTPTLAAYTTGMTVLLSVAVDNTGATTLNIDTLGAKGIKAITGGTKADPATGDIDADGLYLLAYDGTNFILTRSDTSTGNLGDLGNVTEASPADNDLLQYVTDHWENQTLAEAGIQPLDAELTAVAGLSSSGLIARTGAGTMAVRTVTGTANEISVSMGDGVSGNPTLSLTSEIKGWTDDGAEIRLTMSTDEVTVGGAGTLGKFTILGDATAQITQVVKMVAAQTADAVEIQNSAGAMVFQVDKDGFVTQGGQITTGHEWKLGNAGDSGASGLVVHDGDSTAKPGYIQLIANNNDVFLAAAGGTDGKLCVAGSKPGAECTEWVVTSTSDNIKKGVITFIIDGGGSAVTTGAKGWTRVSYAGTITSVEVTADQSGSIVVDIWKDIYANFPPTVADTITAAAKPTLSAAQKSQDSTLTGWTTTFSAGDYLRFNVDSAATVEYVVVSLQVTKD